jgi:stage III sporulation protein SpoIIIAA
MDEPVAMEFPQTQPEVQVTDDIGALVSVMPPRIRGSLEAIEDASDLLEIVLDLGRKPEARFLNREVVLDGNDLTAEDLSLVISRLGAFTTDNRAGIPRTLHRISAIRNRTGEVVGLTCRMGRAVFGTIEIIRDLVESGKSLLLLGSPGVGKTTLLRDVARVLADESNKRVIVVDTSNEIAGDGDIPHAGIGRARRMQVPVSTDQHGVMIEAVENHMPEVIVIDEIGTELEAAAARTIAERGVQLVGTAHGNTLTNLMQNPTLSDLVGGIQSVTLSDEEARRRRSQKSVLERKAPPTFQVLVEIKGWHHMVIHLDVAETIDSLLRGRPIGVEERVRGDDNRVNSSKQVIAPPPGLKSQELWDPATGDSRLQRDRPGAQSNGRQRIPDSRYIPEHWTEDTQSEEPPSRDPISIFPFGVSRKRLEDGAGHLSVPVWVTEDLDAADVVLTLKSYYRQRTGPLRHAERKQVPIFVLRSNAQSQINQSLASIFNLNSNQSSFESEDMRLAEAAVQEALHTSHPVDLPPANAYTRRLQHELAQKFKLGSRSFGKEPNRWVRIHKP